MQRPVKPHCDLKLSFSLIYFVFSPREMLQDTPKASAHAASVMFSDTALLRVIDGCVHLHFRIAKRTARRHGRVSHGVAQDHDRVGGILLLEEVEDNRQ